MAPQAHRNTHGIRRHHERLRGDDSEQLLTLLSVDLTNCSLVERGGRSSETDAAAATRGKRGGSGPESEADSISRRGRPSLRRGAAKACKRLVVREDRKGQCCARIVHDVGEVI